MRRKYICTTSSLDIVLAQPHIADQLENIHLVSENLMEDDYEHVSEELVYCLTNVPGPGLVGGIPADLGGCLCTVSALGILTGWPAS